MPENPQHIARTAANAPSSGAFFKLQINAWTRFDPTKADLNEIARAVNTGNAVVCAIEVERVAAGINEVDDPEVRERFERAAAEDSRQRQNADFRGGSW